MLEREEEKEKEKKLNLSDLIDINFLQEFQDVFAKTANVASITVDDNGPITEPSNFTDFCIRYTRGSAEGYKRCNECDIKCGKIAASTGKPAIYKCHSGLTDFAVPIIVEGQHIASILGGQVLTEAPNEEHFRKLAKELGINENDYIEALSKIKIVPLETIKAAADLLYCVANSISEIGRKNFELIKQSEMGSLQRRITETIRSSLDIDETLTFICEEVGKLFNVQRVSLVQHIIDKPEELIIKKEFKSRTNIKGLSDVNYGKQASAYNTTHVGQGKNIIISDMTNADDIPDYYKKTYIEMGVKSLIALPVEQGDDKWGSIFLSEYDNYRFWTDDDINLLKTISSQIYIAIKQAELYLTTKQQNERELFYSKITEEIRKSLDLEEVKKTIVYELGKAFKADRCYFRSHDKIKDRFLPPDVEYLSSPEIGSLLNIEPDQQGLKYFAEELEKRKKGFYPIVVNEEFAKGTLLASYMKSSGIKADYAIPIIDRQDELVWLVLHYSNEDPKFNEEYKKLLETIAYQIDTAFSQIKLYDAAKKTAEREHLYRGITETIRSSLDIDETLTFVCNEVGKLFNVQRVSLVQNFVETPEDLILKKEFKSRSDIIGLRDVNYDKRTAAYNSTHVGHGKNIIVSDISSANVPEYYKETYKAMGVKSLIALPIEQGNDKWGGIFLSEYDNYRFWTDDEINLLKTISSQVYIAIKQAELYKALKQNTSNLYAILNNMPFMAWLKDDKSRLLAVNNEFAKMCSTSIEDLVGKTDFDFFPKEHAEHYVKEDRAVMEKRKTLPSVDLIVGPNGERWHETLKSPVFDDKGNVVGTVGLSRDITERKEAELELLRRQEQIVKANKRESLLRNIFETMRSSLDVNVIKSTMVTELGKALNTDICFMMLYDPMKDIFYIDEYSEYRSSEREKSFVGADSKDPKFKFFMNAFKNNQEVNFHIAEEYITEHNLQGTPEEGFLKEYNIKSSYNVPIYYANTLLGFIITFYTQDYKDLDKNDLEFLRTIATQAGIAINQAELYTTIQKTAENEKVLRDIMLSSMSNFELHEVIKSIVTEAGKVFDADRCFFVEYNSETDSNRSIKDYAEYLSSKDIQSHLIRQPNEIETEIFVKWLKQENIITVNDTKKGNLPKEIRQMLIDVLSVKSYLIAPVYYGDTPYGVIVLHYVNNFMEFTKDEIDLAKSIANQSAVVIHQAKLYKLTQVQAEREKLLGNVIAKAISTFDIDKIKQIVSEIGLITKADRCYFVEVDLEGKRGMPIDENSEYLSSPDIQSLVGYAFSPEDVKDVFNIMLEAKDAIIFDFEDTSKEQNKNYTGSLFKVECEKFPTLKKFGELAKIRTAIGIPFIYQNEIRATLGIEYMNERVFPSEDESNFLRILGNQIGMAFNQIKLYQDTKTVAEKEKLLGNIAVKAISTLDIKEVIKSIIIETGISFNADRCFFVEYDSDCTLPMKSSVEYLSSSDIQSHTSRLPNQKEVEVFATAIEQKKIIACDDIKTIPAEIKSILMELSVKSYLNIPVYYGNVIYGVIVLHYVNNFKQFTQNDIEMAQAIANQSALVIRQAQLYSTIEKNENYTRTVLNSIKDAIVTINDDFVIESCNPAVEAIWGYTLSETIGKKLDLLLDHECNNEDKRVCLAKKELLGTTKNGEKFPIEIDVSEINFENVQSTLLVIRDITERKKIDKMKNEFVSTVSHELRTPLTSIKGSLGLVQSGAFGVLPEKVNELISIASNNCSRLTNLINDILDLEKIKAGKYEFKYEELEMNDIIEQSIILNQAYADQFGMKIAKVLLTEESFIKADKNRILQVISNLISNAVKFSNLGGEVKVTLEKVNDKIKISFIDKGIGIPEESKHKIFNSFSQVDSSDSRSKGGTGLGLSICKLLIEKMGGEIGFDSVAGKGSTFFFIMPTVARGSVKSEDGTIKDLSPDEDQW